VNPVFLVVDVVTGPETAQLKGEEVAAAAAGCPEIEVVVTVAMVPDTSLVTVLVAEDVGDLAVAGAGTTQGATEVTIRVVDHRLRDLLDPEIAGLPLLGVHPGVSVVAHPAGAQTAAVAPPLPTAKLATGGLQ